MKGYIYKIQPTVEHQPEEVYIGSTTQKLNVRLSKHKSDYGRYLNNKYHNISVFKIFDKYGLNNIEIVLLQELEFNDKKELTNLEGVYIKNNQCVNKHIMGRTDKQYREDHKNTLKKYFEEYYVDNKDRISDLKKEKIICNICNCSIRKNEFSRHCKSIKHQQALNNHKPVIKIYINMENVENFINN
jgi:hypothetical protein